MSVHNTHTYACTHPLGLCWCRRNCVSHEWTRAPKLTREKCHRGGRKAESRLIWKVSGPSACKLINTQHLRTKTRTFPCKQTQLRRPIHRLCHRNSRRYKWRKFGSVRWVSEPGGQRLTLSNVVTIANRLFQLKSQISLHRFRKELADYT